MSAGGTDGVHAWTGIAFAVGSAVLFGASTPFAKQLLDGLSPWLMAGLLYLGVGIGLGLVQLVLQTRGRRLEASLQKSDMGWLAAIVFFGGVAGPVLLMIGLQTSTAAVTALLLNVEGLATVALAWIFYRENVDLRIAMGAVAILLGAVILSWQGGALGLGPGAVAVVMACLCWGIDNNLTRNLSAADPVQIAMIKGLAAGVINILLGLGQGAEVPSLGISLLAMTLGFIAYGLSLVMFIYGLRHLGTARTGAYFSLAPFIGAALAVLLFGDELTYKLGLAAILMAIGLYLHLAERHEHEHRHETLLHAHAHSHDLHHQHEHLTSDPDGKSHVHLHRHAPMIHRHPHFPDIHHRHNH